MSSRDADRRARVVTVIGILAVVVAGAFAVSANLGILSASSSADVGALAAAGDLVPSTGGAATPTTAATTSTTPTQTYLVDVAGTVTIDDADPIAIHAVDVNPGWHWRAAPSSGTDVAVELSNGMRTLHFSAARAADGTIAAVLHETTTGTPPGATAATTPSSPHHDDQGDADHENEEHEGRDDDD